jgi:hypothetical protein
MVFRVLADATVILHVGFVAENLAAVFEERFCSSSSI